MIRNTHIEFVCGLKKQNSKEGNSVFQVQTPNCLRTLAHILALKERKCFWGRKWFESDKCAAI